MIMITLTWSCCQHKDTGEDNVLIYTLDNTNREEADRITSIIGSFPPDVTQNIEIRILKK